MLFSTGYISEGKRLETPVFKFIRPGKSNLDFPD